jgi:hypothetical protein
VPLSSSCPFRHDAGNGGIGFPERRKLDETCQFVGMVWPDDVTLLTAGAVVAAVVGAGAAVVDVLVAGAAVVLVGAEVVAVVGVGVAAVAGLAVTVGAAVAAGTTGAAGDWAAGETGATDGRAVVDDVGVVAAVGVVDGCSAAGGAGSAADAAGATADFELSGTALPGSATGGASGTVSSTTMVVSGWPGAPFLVTTCFFVTITTEPGPPESAGTPALADVLKPRMDTPDSAATEIAPVARTSTPAEAEANAFFLNMGQTVMIAWLAVD